jgi:hypothetical protein
MHINEKLDLIGSQLVNRVEELQKVKIKNNDKSINEILAVALHYCTIIVTMKELSKKISLSLYKNEISQQIKLIDEFIEITEDIKVAA